MTASGDGSVDSSGERVIAVTGAAGFVGRWLMRHLADRSAGTGIVARSFFDDGRPGDICDAERVARTVRETRPFAIVHLAAIAAPIEAKRSPRQAWEVNHTGTFNLAHAIMEHSPQTRLVFASTSEVYGDSFSAVRGPMSERGAMLPLTPYAATKAAADLMLGQMARDGLACVRFRAFNHTGPGQSERYVVAAFARQIARVEMGLQPPVIEVGNLAAERDFLDVRDVVRAYAAAATAEPGLAAGVAVNLASGVPRRLGDVLDRMLALSEKRIEIVADPAMFRPGEVARVHGSAALAGKLLGWAPAIDFDDTLRDVLDDWRRRARP